MSARIRIAVMGAGLIGRRHVEHVLKVDCAELAAVIDPSAEARDWAKAKSLTWAASLDDLEPAAKPDGVIVATPNQLHVEHGLASVRAGLPVLVEKPLADDLAGARLLVESADASGCPLLVGHHRRHNPLMAAARRVIDSGELGQVIVGHAVCWFYKPDDYFDIAWRREPGAGPLFLNAIHDVDNLRFLCGDVAEVMSYQSNAVRGNPVEETSVALLRFENGALVTLSVCDAAVAPWSWEMTTGENPAYPQFDGYCYQLAGTRGALSIPELALWSNLGKRSWWEPLEARSIAYEKGDPLTVQIEHFCDVIAGRTEPLVTGADGVKALEVVAAIKEAARSGGRVSLSAPGGLDRSAA